jgi:hypothetical protein
VRGKGEILRRKYTIELGVFCVWASFPTETIVGLDGCKARFVSLRIVAGFSDLSAFCCLTYAFSVRNSRDEISGWDLG